MAAKSSGGLYKRSHQFTADTLAALQKVAAHEGISESAANRLLVTYGVRVWELKHPVNGRAEDLAVKAAAREGEAA